MVNRAFQSLSKRVNQVEYLIGYEGNAFVFTGHAEQDPLSITAVHPMRKEAIRDFLARVCVDWFMVIDLCARGKLIETKFDGHKFYMRKFNSAELKITK